MDLVTVKEILEAEILCGEEFLGKEIKSACGADLLSDVLAFTKAGALLLTGLTNLQVIRTAELTDISAVCFVRGKKPDRDIIALSKEKQIPLLSTHLLMFDACGRLFLKGLKSCS